VITVPSKTIKVRILEIHYENPLKIFYNAEDNANIKYAGAS
jgi:hypothetical protein